MKIYKDLGKALKAREDVQYLMITLKGKEFPEDLLHFPKLQELSFRAPDFTGDLSALFNLPHLVNLKIIETPLTTFYLPLGHAVAPLKSLTIKDSSLKELPEEISVLSRLTDMNLSGNQLKSLPFSFTDLIYLKRLNLDHNQFSLFPDMIKKMRSLSHLSCDLNDFSEEEKARIHREFNIWVN
ncbi:MAG: hypothetical protein NDI69_04080 [Bacteriovoracaceae bacterium]|nr:hypothetical protein [Bacteriovoracaceae bacterium]